MLGMFRSLRFRLVVTFVLVVGVINAMFGLGGVALREWQLRDRFDAALGEQTDRLAAFLQPRLARGLPPDALLHDDDRPFAEEPLYLQLRRPDGEIIAKTSNLRSQTMPLPEPAEGARGAFFQTVSGPGLDQYRSAPERVRVFTRPLTLRGEPVYLLQVGRSLEFVEESLAFLRSLLWIVLPMGLVGAAIAAWIVVGRAMAKLRVVSRTASHITPQHLDQRIEVASGDEEISRLVDELNHMLGRLEASFKAQQRFIANASHALQTPVAVLLSEAQVLQNADASAEECRRFVSSVEQEMRQISKMVGSLLSLIRMESGELARAERLLSLNDVVLAAVESCQESAEEHGVTIQVTLPDPAEQQTEPEVVGDAGLLETLLENLIRNALRHQPQGRPVTVTLAIDVDQALLTVTDEGPPMSEAALRAAFDRVTEEGDEDGRTTGLGLAIARAVAELHNGALGIRNREGRGMAVFVWLPLVSAQASTLPRAEP